MDRIFDYGVPFEMLVKGRWPDATFDIFDVNSLITDIYNNPSGYLDAPANVTGWYHNCDTEGANCVDATNPLNTFLWYDSLHPSERTGKLTTWDINVSTCTPPHAQYSRLTTASLCR